MQNTSDRSASIDAESLLINVPFSPQSPFANWDVIHEDACEEMSLILVHHYLERTPINRTQAEEELQALIVWEHEHGYGDDVTALQLGEIARDVYGYRFRILKEPTVSMLRQELSKGNPVIVPAAGRRLENPYFSGAGPWYHMLVVTGYNETGFITNDVGTKRGENYWYPTNILMSAIHDWTGVKEEIEKGPKTALVIERS